MSQRQRTTITTVQKLRLNLGLAASIRVLREDATGLALYLEEQAAQNPYLHLSRQEPAPGEWLPRWNAAFAAPLPGQGGVAAASPSLMAHVCAAIDAIFPKGPARRIAMAFAEALEPSGWLGQPLAGIAAQAGAGTEEAEAVLRRLQWIEPAGLFARSLAECLALQAQEAGWLDPPMAAVLSNLDLVAAGETARLARAAGIGEAEVAIYLRRLRSFNPKPGTAFEHAAAPTRAPDLCAWLGPEGWVVELNRSALPALLVAAPPRGQADLAARAQVAAARALVRQVEARGATLLRIAQEILHRQPGVLEGGIVALRPMTMADLAEATGLHQSTVSRAVAGTAIDTPMGTFWLRRMFSVGVGRAGEDAAGAALRAQIARLVAAEDPRHPLADAELAAALGAPSRRTVAKYRAMLAIPPAHRRRR